jgi:RNA polymerase sigma-70 factor (ECF subfamily)
VSDPARGEVRALVELYDRALEEVYGYLRHRCGDANLAEDLTSETFMAATRAVRDGRPVDLTTAWLIAVARNKLVDHWRRQGREDSALAAVHAGDDAGHWNEPLDLTRAGEVLRHLGPHHRIVLTLRYVDDLPVRDIAETVGRTEHATEALLVRARQAFRRAYTEGGADA